MADKRTLDPRVDHVDDKHVDDNPFAPCDPRERQAGPPPHVHMRPHGFRCTTDRRGYARPGGGVMSLTRIRVDASEGVVPLWGKDVILRWRFAPGTLEHFRNPAAAADAIEELLGEAILAWGDAAPVRFTKRDDASADFEIIVSHVNDCEDGGCVLASAFFPDAGRHKLRIYPALFSQSRKEQVETLIHEVGHIFGLRHFFAEIREGRWASELFGADNRFTIMNYGEDSFLTEQDKLDLKRLYDLVWSGQLSHVNETPIRLMRPYHETVAPDRAFAIAAVGA